ncbi:hypothetical protein [Candidatus Berkiella aquae]|uniref:Uncharacterized protein n=1 Tax=Candidatus Berkiella aquae TaxID=295108 RepID=A0A0Q9YW10_9GAMM|nr:hypothetical protein [Candidatus Berkiella aquae]MCS5711277.1 hypothetical protein [Candidatus Berkiella aquae]
MLNSIYDFVKSIAFTPILEPIYKTVQIPSVTTVCKPILETIKNCSWFGLVCEEVIKETGNRCTAKQQFQEYSEFAGYKEVGSEFNPYFLATTAAIAGAVTATAALAGGYYWYQKRNASNKKALIDLVDVKIEPKNEEGSYWRERHALEASKIESKKAARLH